MSQTHNKKLSIRIGPREGKYISNAIIGLIIVGLILIAQPFYKRMVETRDLQTCQSNAQVIAKAIQTYSADWDDTLPPGERWMENIYSNIAPRSGSGFKPEDYLRCPKDKSKSDSSYAYNDMVAGLSFTVKPDEAEANARWNRLGDLGKVAMIFEKHGSARNAHATLATWDDLAKELTMPHQGPTVVVGSIVLAGGQVGYRNKLQMQEFSGYRFDGTKPVKAADKPIKP